MHVSRKEEWASRSCTFFSDQTHLSGYMEHDDEKNVLVVMANTIAVAAGTCFLYCFGSCCVGLESNEKRKLALSLKILGNTCTCAWTANCL